MIRRSLSANLHHDSFAGLQRAFNPNIALLLPRGQRLNDLPGIALCRRSRKRRNAGPLVALQPSALLALFLRPLILEVTIIPFIMVIPPSSSSLSAAGGAIPTPWELRSISFQRERKQRILPCYILGGTKWKKGRGILGGVRGGSKKYLKEINSRRYLKL